VGDILRNQGQLELAVPHYQEALAIYRSHPQTPPLDLANAIRGYALLKAGIGDITEAKQLWQEAGRLYAKVGVQAGVTESEAQIAHLTAS
jgi:tetratricopeptide (TPR) repeat protein